MITVNSLDSGCNLDNIRPENLFVGRCTVAISIGGGEVMFSQGLRHGMIVIDEYKRAIAESLSGKGIDNRHDAAIVNMLPLFDLRDGSSVAQAKSYITLAMINRVASELGTFESTEDIIFTILLLSLVDPTWKAEDGRTLVVVGVQWN
jgi:hypothetical protein